jgi:hypothetical protein
VAKCLPISWKLDSDFKISMTGGLLVLPRLNYSVTGERTNEVNLDQGPGCAGILEEAIILWEEGPDLGF